MKKPKTIFKELAVNPYCVTLWVLITNNPLFETAKLNQKYKDLCLKWSDDSAAWTEDNFYQDNYLTVIFSPENFDVGAITHEVVHIKNLVFKHAGIKHDGSNDEPEDLPVGMVSR